MKIVCPNNEDHREFYTVINVDQGWIVGENGDFLRHIEDLEFTRSDIYYCDDCDEEAKVEE
jgi:hypothetical protein